MAQQTALISGITGNLGKAVAQHFFERSWQVTGTSHKEVTHNDFDIVPVDLTNEQAADKYVRNAIQKFGAIDIAVLTVGGFAMGALADTGIQEIEKFFRLNFETAYNLVRPLYQHMKSRQKGKFFFIGSGQGLNTRSGKEAVAYSLSKSLLFQLANIINTEKATSGVEAFAVVPAIIDTVQNREAMPKADFGQWQKPEDIAAIIGRYASYQAAGNEIIIIKDELL
ncbi:MAG TPA: SDR family NAD(P)-dependent oxidoreductase [Edaphocola sp.]|nr:SDR family NAD(P)-dependent oxidoreductase [Edaphocola sp.]